MNNNYNIAVSVINLFSDGLSSNNYVKVREALGMVRNDGFSCDGLDTKRLNLSYDNEVG